MEFPPEEKVTLNKDFIKEMENILKFNEDVEVVSSVVENPTEDILDIRISNEDVLPIVEETIDENEKEVEIDKDLLPKKEEILKTDYVTAFFFYRVRNKENLEDILNRFNMTKDEFIHLNKKTEIKENDLVQLKIK